MSKPLKIAIYSGEIPSATFIERLILGIAGTGKRVLLFGAINSKISYPTNVHILGYRSQKISKLCYLTYYSALLIVFKRSKKLKLDAILKTQKKNNLYTKVKFYPVLWHQPDVFHIQWAKGLKDWVWVQEFGMKLVLSLRGAHINYSPKTDVELATMYRRYFPKVDGFHAVSKAIALESQKYGAPKNRIKVVYSGLDAVNYELKKNVFNQPFQLLSVGRPHWKKGYSYALDACKLLKMAGFKFGYTIIGGAGHVELMYQVHDLDLQDVVLLVENKPFEVVQKCMLEADLLVLPSVEEGVANVVLESMHLGTLVLSTNCGGMEEVLQHEKNGFVVPIRDSQAIAHAVLAIQALSPDICLKIREAAQTTIKKQHSESQMVTGMLDLYNQTLKPIST